MLKGSGKYFANIFIAAISVSLFLFLLLHTVLDSLRLENPKLVSLGKSDVHKQCRIELLKTTLKVPPGLGYLRVSSF